MLRTAACLATAALLATGALEARAADEYGPPEVIAGAKTEGRLTVYTAHIMETEQALAKAFNKRFPFVKVEIMRAPGGQLLTRIKTEAAAGKLGADVIELSDRGEAKAIQDLYMEHAPPNGGEYPPEAVIVPNKLWPRTSVGWCIASNTELVPNPPKSFMDLLKPEYKNAGIGQVIAGSGGTTWTRIMFERKVLGEDYWKRIAAQQTTLYPSAAPTSDSLVRGEIKMGAVQMNAILPKMRDGAPLRVFYPPEGQPLTVYAFGIAKTAAHPNAAKLYLNWGLSREGQEAYVAEGGLSTLRNGPVPEGADPTGMKMWYPDLNELDTLRTAWVEEWNKLHDYRQ